MKERKRERENERTRDRENEKKRELERRVNERKRERENERKRERENERKRERENERKREIERRVGGPTELPECVVEPRRAQHVVSAVARRRPAEVEAQLGEEIALPHEPP